MPAPRRPPIGLELARTARTVSRAFEQALREAGGSTPVWLILLSVVSGRAATQRELAAAVGIREATLTHHLNAMEADGLVVRLRHDDNRRVSVIELTAAGRAAFATLRDAAGRFDRRLRRGLSEPEADALRTALARLSDNVAQSRW
jgi:MarR family transcriptional regulator for hemolysin